MNLINLGCGQCFHKAWTNIDLHDDPKANVKGMDLTTPFLIEDSSFDVAYSSHVLEHFHPLDAAKFLNECHRILTPGGILRLAVPDLEEITRNYLACLEKCLENQESAGPSEVEKSENDYDWMMLELYDQVIRDYPGGRMGERLSDPNLPNREFLISRIGNTANKVHSGRPHRSSIWHWETPTFQYSLRFGLKGIAEWFLNRVNPSAYQELRHGRFRLSGEVHLWMYDRFSLGRLLRSAGFQDPEVKRANESSILNWQSYQLDMDESGKTRKPDSLFMECRKPA